MRWLLVAVMCGAIASAEIQEFDQVIANEVIIKDVIRAVFGDFEIEADGTGDVTFTLGRGSLEFVFSDTAATLTLGAPVEIEAATTDTLTVNDALNFFWAGGTQLWADLGFISELTIDTTLTCNGQATFNEGVYTEDSLVVNSGAFINWLSLSGAGHFWGIADFDSLVTFQERIELNAVRDTTDYAYGLDLQGTGFFSGGAAQKTYLANFEGTRIAADTMSGDSRDRLIGGSYGNYAVNDAASVAHGIGLNVRNRSGGFLATIKASELQVNNNSGATADNLYAGTFLVENYGTLNNLLCGVLVELKNEGAAATDEYGVHITNTNNSAGTAVDAAIYVDDTGANIGWTHGLDFINATVQTAEIRGQNEETIANTANGYWDFTGTIRGTVDATGGVTDTLVVGADSVRIVDGIIVSIF